MNRYYVYIIECSDSKKSLYTGISNNVVERIKKHNNGRGAKFTRGRSPVKLLSFWICDSKSHALRCEKLIKKMSRTEKLNIIKNASNVRWE